MSQTTATAAESARYPLLERVPSAATLALVAGLLNAWTFANAQAFATVQSGNIVTLGYEIVAGNWGRVGFVGVAILAFATGAFLCTLFILLMSRLRHTYSAAVLAFEVAALILLGILAATGGANAIALTWAVSFIAGVQGNAFHRETGMVYGNVAVTFVLQNVGSLLGRAAGHRIASDDQPHLRPAGAYLAVLVAFAVGGGAGFALDQLWRDLAFFVAALVLAVFALVAMTYRGPEDPTGNAPTP